MPIKVLIVDDSALIRALLKEIIQQDPELQLVGQAPDAYVARDLIKQLNPDVITLDIEMPKMDGIDFLGRIMRLRPMPVVMISTLTERGAEVTMRALELGAIDFVAKPRVGVANGLQELASQIVDKIRVAAVAQVHRLPVVPHGVAAAASAGAKPAAPRAPAAPSLLGRISTEKIIAIGASTGGTEAIREVLTHLPADCPAIVITQHMPPGFTTSFAARLNSLCQMTVKEATHGERLLPGHAYIAPGGKHFSITRSGANYVAVVDDAPPVNRHKPSVEVLFKSVSASAGRNAYGIMLTGMGADGATAMREMRDAGSYNLVQDESTCIVFGMPREAIAHGAADEVLPLPQIAHALLTKLRGGSDQVHHRI